MNIEKIIYKTQLATYYQGLNTRLAMIASDLAKVEAQQESYEEQFPDAKVGKVPSDRLEEYIFRIIYAARLRKEATEIARITNPTPPAKTPPSDPPHTAPERTDPVAALHAPPQAPAAPHADPFAAP